MQPIRSVEEGIRRIDAFEGSPEEFELVVPDSMLDPLGVALAMLTDRVLARGWEPNGFKDGAGFRCLLYKALE